MKRQATQELPEIPILPIFEQKLASFLEGLVWQKIGPELKSRETLKVVRLPVKVVNVRKSRQKNQTHESREPDSRVKVVG
jgi:hypothetical protein